MDWLPIVKSGFVKGITCVALGACLFLAPSVLSVALGPLDRASFLFARGLGAALAVGGILAMLSSD